MDQELHEAAARRLVVLEAMIKAQRDLPSLVGIMMNSADTTAAQTAVAHHFGLSPELAVVILDMQVRRMSQSERTKLVEERDALVRGPAN